MHEQFCFYFAYSKHDNKILCLIILLKEINSQLSKYNFINNTRYNTIQKKMCKCFHVSHLSAKRTHISHILEDISDHIMSSLGISPEHKGGRSKSVPRPELSSPLPLYLYVPVSMCTLSNTILRKSISFQTFINCH